MAVIKANEGDVLTVKNAAGATNTGLDGAGRFSKLFWLWIGDLVNIANETPLTAKHLGSLPEDSKCGPLLARFDAEWTTEKEKPQPSVIAALMATFKIAMYRTGLVEFLVKCSQLSIPVVVQLLLHWFASGEGSNLLGATYAMVLFGTAVVFQGLIQAHNFMLVYKTGMDIRTILCALIYEKALTVATSARSTLTTGEIVNLMSADAEKVVFTCLMFHGLWTTPLFLIAAIWLLVRLVGVAIVPGLAMIILTAPVQGYVISQQHKLQRLVMVKSDARVKLVNEVLQGVRVVKYYNWEASFEKRLGDARAQELALIKKLATINAFNSALMTTVPMLMLIAMLMTFYATGGNFAPETVFVAVSLLVLIRFPLIMLPMTIGACVMGMISVKRVQRFLLLDDMPRFKPAAGGGGNGRGSVSRARPDLFTMDRVKLSAAEQKLPKGALRVKEGAFQWASATAPGPDSKAVQAATSKAAAEAAAPAHSPEAGSAGLILSPARTPAGTPMGLVADAPSGFSEGPEKGPAGLLDDPEAIVAGGASPVAAPAWRLRLRPMEVPPGTLLAVTGQVGSGKTSFLAALLGELDPASVQDGAAGGPGPGQLLGQANLAPVIRGSVGYAAQQPWIMNATLRDNVLFGHRFDEARYRRVLACCCLLPDLAQLPGGDETEIGEKGINLSGGQKARVGLARAVYADADVLLLDDVLAAVDAHVGKALFEQCVLGELRAKGKTVVLVTNQLSLLSRVDDVVVMRGGAVAEHGTCETLRKAGPGNAFAELMNAYVPEDAKAAEAPEGGSAGAGAGGGSPQISPQQRARAASGGKGGLPEGGFALDGEGPAAAAAKAKAGQLVAEESKATGTVGLKVYLAYFVEAVRDRLWWKYFNLFSLLFLSAFAQCAVLVFDWWLSRWSDEWAKARDGGKDLSQADQRVFMGIYVGLGVFAILVGLARYLNHARHSTAAAGGLFTALLKGVLHSPIEFFDTTPIGRILNRFSKDTDNNDTQLPQNLMSFDMCIMTVFGTLIMCGVMMPPFVAILVPVLATYVTIMLRYVPVSRDLQRIESMSRSPIFAQFSETLAGTATVRAFGKTGSFVAANRARLDEANRAFFYLHNANRWLQLRLEALGAVVICSVALIVVWERAAAESHASETPEGPTEEVVNGALGPALKVGVAGLVLTYTQQITGLMNWAVRMACEVESRMTCVERNGEYASMPSEQGELVPADRVETTNAGGVSTPWPASGAVAFDNVSMRYRAGLPLVLRGCSLTIAGGTKVGVCGRSGSGKSSLLVALFRMTPIEGTGRILLDGVDVLSLSLRQLRRTVGIIPQDPVLFVGTLRGNLDAFGEHTDAELWDALGCAALDGAAMAEAHPGGLDAPVDEGGANWSTGQRQLICLARAVLRKPRVLAIDEATANIDLETDAVVQRSIRTRFKAATTLTIAHRLSTILDADLIVTMDDGRVAEAGSPASLLANPRSLFTALVRNDKSAAAAAGLEPTKAA